MNRLNIRKYHILKKNVFEVTSSFAFKCILHSFLNIRNILQFSVDYIIEWYKIVLIYKKKKDVSTLDLNYDQKQPLLSSVLENMYSWN